MAKLSERVKATGQAVLRSGPEALAANEVNDDALLDRQALCLVDGERKARYEGKLRPSHASAIFDCCLG